MYGKTRFSNRPTKQDIELAKWVSDSIEKDDVPQIDTLYCNNVDCAVESINFDLDEIDINHETYDFLPCHECDELLCTRKF